MSARQRFESLTSQKETYLQRAREASRLTLPHIMPFEHSQNTTQTLPTPFQSVGAMGVNTLSSKLLLTMFPSGTPFFKYEIDQLEMHKINQEIDQLSAQLVALGDSPQTQEIAAQLSDRKTFEGDIKKSLSRFEKKVISIVEEHNIKNSMLTALQQLLVTGNVCIHISENFKTKVFNLDNFACDRDREGNIKELITREKVFSQSIPQDKRPGNSDHNSDHKEDGKTSHNTSHGRDDSNKEVWIYTHITRVDDEWIVKEVIGDTISSIARFPLNSLPFIVPRMNMMVGENYNYGFVTELLGDLITLEGLQKAIVQGAAAASKILWLVKPNSMVKIRQLQNTRNGGFITGNAGDIEALQLNKQADLAVAQQQAQLISRQLSAAFLMNIAVQREGERVTATEINRLATDLDTRLGGLYSILAAEIQLPLVNIITFYLNKSGDLPTLPNNIRPSIVTGVDAIGRNADANNLLNYVSTLNQIGMSQFINKEELANRLAASLLIETDGLIKSEQEVQAEQAAAQQAQLQSSLAEKSVSAIANNATKNISETEEGE